MRIGFGREENMRAIFFPLFDELRTESSKSGSSPISITMCWTRPLMSKPFNSLKFRSNSLVPMRLVNDMVPE